MSQQLISLNSDLSQLRDDGFELEVRGGYLLAHNIPYVNSQREIKRGTLISTLDLAGDSTIQPTTHVALFAGEFPCDAQGKPIAQIRHQSIRTAIPGGMVATESFSAKPKSGKYLNYYEKITTYAAILSGPAESIDSTVTARTYAVIEPSQEDSVFNYIDTFSSRAGISAINEKVASLKVAILGVGGTGSYILDFVAKTPVREIHLYDSDELITHNVFRSPGAVDIVAIRRRPNKAEHFAEIYSKMHRGIIPHKSAITIENVSQILAMDFIFIATGDFEGKAEILRAIEAENIPYVDVGIGVELIDAALIGVLRVTTSTKEMRAHVWDRGRIPIGAAEADAQYSTNIQIAELNAMNATMAVIKWKKLFGFYQDLEREHFSTYSTNVNLLTSEELS